ncbi:hypothetical protein Tco_0531450 [Tanacetum coccineum]
MATNEETYDQPLAMTTTNIFEVNYEDAYDSDVDEGPNAAAAFMANLSSTRDAPGRNLDSDAETELMTIRSPYISTVTRSRLYCQRSSNCLVDADTLSCIPLTILLAYGISEDVWYTKVKELSQEQAYWLFANENC